MNTSCAMPPGMLVSAEDAEESVTALRQVPVPHSRHCPPGQGHINGWCLSAGRADHKLISAGLPSAPAIISFRQGRVIGKPSCNRLPSQSIFRAGAGQAGQKPTEQEEISLGDGDDADNGGDAAPKGKACREGVPCHTPHALGSLPSHLLWGPPPSQGGEVQAVHIVQKLPLPVTTGSVGLDTECKVGSRGRLDFVAMLDLASGQPDEVRCTLIPLDLTAGAGVSPALACAL